MTSVQEEKINKQIKLMKQMPPNMKHIILANMNVNVFSLTTYVSQGSVATYLFQPPLQILMNSTVKKL